MASEIFTPLQEAQLKTIAENYGLEAVMVKFGEETSEYNAELLKDIGKFKVTKESQDGEDTFAELADSFVVAYQLSYLVSRNPEILQKIRTVAAAKHSSV